MYTCPTVKRTVVEARGLLADALRHSARALSLARHLWHLACSGWCWGVADGALGGSGYKERDRVSMRRCQQHVAYSIGTQPLSASSLKPIFVYSSHQNEHDI